MATVYDEFQVCSDCYEAVNGCYDSWRPEEEPGLSASLAATLAYELATGTQLVDATFEPGFSWYACHLCKSELGGNRYTVAALRNQVAS
jgi:hypothetical protein